MGNTLFAVMATAALTFVTTIQGFFSPASLTPPQNTDTETTTVALEYVPNPLQYPVRVLIPAITLDSPIEYVGINAKGEMAVPDGKTKNVGWYQYGTLPGDLGNAVLAAHVYAAFSNLDNLKPGTDVFVETVGNGKLHFKVDDIKDYKLSDLTPEMLFGSKGDKRINLITCSGTYRSDIETYDHRLVISATLVEEA
jgi:sortase A